MAIIKKKIKSKEIEDLLKRITEGATGQNTPIGEMLRLCMRLGKELHNEELFKWAQSELNGYKSKSELPDYRVFGSPVSGHFSGPFGSGIRNAHIPQSVIEEKHRDFLFTNYIDQPVAELEQLATRGKDGESLQSYWPADIIAYYQRKTIYEDMILASAWRVISKPTITGILDTVRTRVLEFVLQISEEFDFKVPVGKGEEKEITKPMAEKVSQIVSNTIYGGNVAIGNLGSTTQQNIQVQPGDLQSLKKYLEGLGLTEESTEDLEKSLAKDEKSEEQPGPQTKSWLSRTMIAIGKGSISVVSNTAGSLIATAVMKYLGL